MRDQVELVFHPSPSLERLYLELTNRCNLSCVMCYRKDWQEPVGDMSEETLAKIGQEASRFPDLREVILGGIGEPTIAPTFPTAVALFAPHYEVTVTTNGTNLSEQLTDFLLAHKVARIVISVDSADSTTFNDLRHTGLDSILTATEKLTRGKRLGKPEIVWEFVAMKSTLPHLSATVKKAAESGVDRVLISHVLPFSSEIREETLYHPLSPEIEGIFKKTLFYCFR